MNKDRKPLEKPKILADIPKNGQEEMIGFALIIILVAIVILVFIGFSLRNSPDENVESYKVESFIQSSLQYTTECKTNFGFLNVQKLVGFCSEFRNCESGENSCVLLKSTLEDATNEGWPFGDERPVKGYEFIINSESKEIFSSKQGTQTNNYRAALYPFPVSGELFEAQLKIYY